MKHWVLFGFVLRVQGSVKELIRAGKTCTTFKKAQVEATQSPEGVGRVERNHRARLIFFQAERENANVIIQCFEIGG